MGNPGLKYKKTRHNLGFMVLDAFSKENNFPKFKLQKKFLAKISEGALDNKKVLLVKPQTFMNDSGKAVKLIAGFYKIPIEKIIVIHDDSDLLVGETKTSQNIGSAGHKGAQSIINELGSQNFIRLRIGIRPAGSIQPAEQFVLKKFSKQEMKILENVIKKSCRTLHTTDERQKR